MKSKGVIYHYKDSIPGEIIAVSDKVTDTEVAVHDRVEDAQILCATGIWIDHILWRFEDEYIAVVKTHNKFIESLRGDKSGENSINNRHAFWGQE